jgi:broad specificity phosphatase PhoE
MKLTLIRHGPTDWNASRRFQGRTDLSLSAAGHANARGIAAQLKAEPLDCIYSSDLLRALETARIVAEDRAVPIVTDARLREFDFGRWEGLTWDEIVAANPHLAGRGSTAAKLYAPDGGENFAQVCARVASFLDDLSREPIENAAIVTHAGPLHALFSVLQLEASATPADNLSLRFAPGGITRIETGNRGAALLSLNELQHLDAAG